MTLDLKQLAQRVAEELARADGASAAPKYDPAMRPPPGVTWVRDQARIADFIDHTLLKPDATRSEVEKLCAEARDNRFAAVCVNPVWVPVCRELLSGSGVGIATVIGFPLGANQPETKAAEAARAVEQGASELDMVAAIGHIKSGDWQHVARDIEAVVRAGSGRLVKVILESALLTPLEIVKASALARESGAQYVKTSTGFNAAGGATPEAVALMRLAVGDALGVKASGGVRDCAAALRMIAAGATRIGSSSGVGMVQCLGTGPLPLHDLLSVAEGHVAHCTAESCSAPEPAAQSASQRY
ncbi:MAG TPA: deoxyribose-phosphate aldolase [Gemmatimonadaceae bacterium]|nr:deoxyribose-phosphate aldolase [Gemmatimonadaceae bacterium]